PSSAPVEKAAALVASAQQALTAAEQVVAERRKPVDAAEQGFKAKDSAAQGATTALATAQAAVKKANEEQVAAGKAHTDSAAAEKLAQDQGAAAGKAVEVSMAAKNAQERVIAEALTGLKTVPSGAALEQAVAGLTEKAKQSAAIRSELETATIR